MRATLKRNSWVKRNEDIGDALNYWNRNYYRVLRVYKDKVFKGEEVLFDAAVYTHNGIKLGRVSPACGGPTKFEPALSMSDFTIVDAPAWAANL